MKQGWEYKKWNEVLTIINGKNQSAVEDTNGEFPIYGSGGIMGYANNWLCPENCVIIGRKGNINKPIFVKTKFWNVDTAFGLNANTEYLLPKYLFYFCLDYNFEKHNKAVTIPSLTKVDLLKIQIPLPPKSTQLSIVSELDKINELIRLKKEQLKDYDNLAQSIFYEMFGDPVENEKKWEVKRLGEVCVKITDGDHMPPPKSESGIPFLTISDINKETRELDFSNTYFVPIEYYNNLKEERKAKLNDVLYTVTGSYGIPVIVKDERQFCFQRHIALIRPQKEVLSTYFLCYWVLSAAVKSIADKVATGIAQKTVGLNSIRKFEIIIPPLPLQHLFAQRIKQIEHQKSEVAKAITDLETLLASRMQHWFE